MSPTRKAVDVMECFFYRESASTPVLFTICYGDADDKTTRTDERTTKMERKLMRKASLTQALAKQVLEQAHVIEQFTRKKNAAREAASLIERGHTYQLRSFNPFRCDPVYKILEQVLTDGLEGFYYNNQEAPALCKQLSAKIRTRIKALKFDRYKLICVVQIVQKNLQGIRSACSFSWDPERDRYAIYKYDKFDLLAIAYVFGVYND